MPTLPGIGHAPELKRGIARRPDSSHTKCPASFAFDGRIRHPLDADGDVHRNAVPSCGLIRSLGALRLVDTPHLPAGLLAASPALDRQFDQTVRPFVAKYCLGCHSGQSAAAQFDLKAYTSLTTVTRDFPRCARVMGNSFGVARSRTTERLCGMSHSPPAMGW